jgi:hypothetical protein
MDTIAVFRFFQVFEIERAFPDKFEHLLVIDAGSAIPIFLETRLADRKHSIFIAPTLSRGTKHLPIPENI